MKIYSLSKTPFEPVSHDPALKKRVLFGSGLLPSIRHVSNIVLKKGSTATIHAHENASEVFYCIKGVVKFRIDGEDILLAKGQLLIIEPGEPHSIEDTPRMAELLYFMVEHY